MFEDAFDPAAALNAMFRRVEVVRGPRTTLFTFGDSELDYYLVIDAETAGEPVTVVRGEVRVSRPTLIRPDSRPELSGFFDDEEGGFTESDGEAWKGGSDAVAFMLSRTAAFQHLNIANRAGRREIRSDSIEEVVDALTRRLDLEDEDTVGVLTAPAGLGPIAVLKFATEQIARSAPGNVRELQEKGLLP